MIKNANLQKLRTLITESIRIQRDTSARVDYIDSGHVLSDVSAKQNHVIYGRRGCGKTLLLHASREKLPGKIKCVYLNCEDFKQHSFPNVLIEILSAIFRELEQYLAGWFGRKKKQKEIIAAIRKTVESLREAPDTLEERVSRSDITACETSVHGTAAAYAVAPPTAVRTSAGGSQRQQDTIAETSEFRRFSDKSQRLNAELPQLKRGLREFFSLTKLTTAVFLQIDDFYHLRLSDQPLVCDYVHRLCKDLPLYFKIATLRHSTSLFIERDGQPIGAQERHDFLPIDIDFTFESFDRTERQFRSILHEYGRQADIKPDELDSLFKGEGFQRLVVAGGGVPRDCLSIFLMAHSKAADTAENRIGKDTIRLLSLETLENRISDLKKDSHAELQDKLLRGIYSIREFCLRNKWNAFVVEERVLRDVPGVNELLYRLLDYRIIHAAASAFTHKTHQGTFRAFVIDMGCYGFWRKLEGKLNEIDVSDKNAKEKLRSAPRLTEDDLKELSSQAPPNVEERIKEEPPEL